MPKLWSFMILKLTLQLVILSAKSAQMLLYHYIYSIEASREWITSSLDATLIFLYVDLKFMPQVFGYFFSLI